MVPSRPGKGKAKGGKVPTGVIKSLHKTGRSATPKGKGKGGKKGSSGAEKRIDPSDNNGPFSHASFIKYHGPELGENLWNQAGEIAKTEKLKPERGERGPSRPDSGRKGKGKGGSTPDAAASSSSRNGKGSEAKGSKGKGKSGSSSSSGPAVIKDNVKKGSSKGRSEDAVSKNNPFTSGSKSKGSGKGGAEKRMDPSDGRGPFSFASFLKYHGEKKGKTLWEQAKRK